jgi:hypothetical protein
MGQRNDQPPADRESAGGFFMRCAAIWRKKVKKNPAGE